jgi:hypothetical protein
VCAAASAAAFACDGTGSAEAIATQTAKAYAAAVASATVTCVLAGDATASVKASAQARARAEIWISAYFDAISFAATCETCQSWASAWGYIEKWVFLEAVAKAEVRVCGILLNETCFCPKQLAADLDSLLSSISFSHFL